MGGTAPVVIGVEVSKTSIKESLAKLKTEYDPGSSVDSDIGSSGPKT